MNSEQYLDSKGRAYDLGHTDPSGTPVSSRLYGGLCARYWMGTPGQSELVGGTAWFWQPIRVVDQEGFEQELKQAFRERIAGGVASKTGLLIGAVDRERIQYLVIWRAEPDLVERCRAFEQGWSAMLPVGKRARDLTPTDLSQLARRIGAIPGRGSAQKPGETR